MEVVQQPRHLRAIGNGDEFRTIERLTQVPPKFEGARGFAPLSFFDKREQRRASVRVRIGSLETSKEDEKDFSGIYNAMPVSENVDEHGFSFIRLRPCVLAPETPNERKDELASVLTGPLLSWAAVVHLMFCYQKNMTSVPLSDALYRPYVRGFNAIVPTRTGDPLSVLIHFKGTEWFIRRSDRVLGDGAVVALWKEASKKKS